MAKIEVGRFSSLLRRYLSLSGVVEVAGEVAPEISPVFVLESDRPEWEFLKGQKLGTSQFHISGTAGNQATARIRNPVGSGVFAVISQINISVSDPAQVVVYRVATAVDLGSVAATVIRDTRYPALNVSALIASIASATSSGDWIWGGYIPAFGHAELFIPFVLGPGHSIDVNCETVNTSLRGNVHWIERPIGALEVA